MAEGITSGALLAQMQTTAAEQLAHTVATNEIQKKYTMAKEALTFESEATKANGNDGAKKAQDMFNLRA